MISLLLVAMANVIVAPVPKDATFGNWTVACDNARYCEAMGAPADGSDDSQWILHVSRGAGAKDSPKSDAGPPFDEGPYNGPYILRLDDKPTAFGWSGEERASRDDLEMLKAIALARKAEVSDKGGKTVATISVAGASAALRWMDDQQKRAGTVTAIVARGPRPATDVPPPPPLPRIVQPPISKKPPRKLTAADVKAIQAKAGDFCEAERGADPTTYRLDDRHTLGIVGCFMGAYQGAALIVVIDEKGHWTPAQIEQPEPLPKEAEPYDAYFLTEGDYLEDQRLLWMSAKGRGLGDCGEHATWAWDGRVFRLAAFLSLDTCVGAEPGTMFSRWQTANDPLPKDW